jgi:hypothetical protein
MMRRFEGFSGMDGSIYVGVEGSQCGENFLNMYVSKAPRQEKGNCAIVESIHLNNMCVAYNHHFVIYSKNKSKNTQLMFLMQCGRLFMFHINWIPKIRVPK